MPIPVRDYNPTNYDEAEPSGPMQNLPAGADPMQSNTGPASDLAQTTAVASIDETPQSLVKQPGNRLSMKEYLAKIKTLQIQQRAMGMAEDQVAVPTFGNVQGGFADQDQGQIMGPGGQEGDVVRGYVEPEFKESGMGIERGPAHPVTQAQEGMGVIQNPYDPRYSDSIAMQHLPEAVDTWEQQTGQRADEAQVSAIAQALRVEAAKAQAAEIKQAKATFGADAASLFKAYESGDMSNIVKERDALLSQESLAKRQAEYFDDFRKAKLKDPMEPVTDPDTGQEFNTPDEYAKYHVEKFIEMMNEMVEAAAENSKYGATKGATAEVTASAEPAKTAGKTAGKKVVKTGTYQGRKVVQYEDGTTDYAPE